MDYAVYASDADSDLAVTRKYLRPQASNAAPTIADSEHMIDME